MDRLPGEIDGRRFLRAMARLGWLVVTQRGSHRKLRHESSEQVVIVAFHSTIRRNAVRYALRLTGISEEDFLRKL